MMVSIRCRSFHFYYFRVFLFILRLSTLSGVLVLIGCILAVKTRNLDPRYGEAKQLAFAMYNIAFTGIILLAVLSAVDMDTNAQVVLIAAGV